MGKALCYTVQPYLNQRQLLEIRRTHQRGTLQFTHSPFWHFPTNTGREGSPNPGALRAQPRAAHPGVWSFALNFLIVRDEMHRCPFVGTCVLPNQGYATCFPSQQPSDVLNFPRIRLTYFIATFSTGLRVILMKISKLTMQTGRRAIIERTLRNK